MPVPRGVHSEVSSQDVVHRASPVFGRSVSAIGRAEAESGGKGAPDARSRSYAPEDSATVEVTGAAFRRPIQGERAAPPPAALSGSHI